MTWMMPKQFAKVTSAGGIQFDVDLSMLEPSERRAVRKAQNITLFKWAELKTRVGVGRAKALQIAGMEVRRQTQRAMSVRKELTFARFIDGGKKDGRQIVIKRYQIPKPDRVTSWKTARWPKGFLRSDIISDYDLGTQSVVIGPRMMPEMNKLHEIGGTVSLWFTPGSVVPKRAPRKFEGAVFGTLSNEPKGVREFVEYRRGRRFIWGESFFWGRRRVKGRRYMGQGLQKAAPKIPEAFRDFISGPAASGQKQLKLF
jgi:hypothetical protein